MTRAGAETIEHYLDRYGWSFNSTSDRTWVSGWQSDERSYPLTLQLSDTWLLMQVKPLFQISLDWEYMPDFARYLLELNNDCHMVKFGIDETGDVVLSLQLFCSALTYDTFSDALGIIGHYSDHAYEGINNFFSTVGYHFNLPQEYLA